MENYSNPLRRQLEWWEIQKLQAQECTCDDWQRVRISDRTDLSRIRNVEFKGDIEIGKMLSGNSEIRNAMIDNCRIGDNVRIVNVGVAIRNYEIDNDAEIQNVGLMEYEDEARCGLGVQVNVLDETGSCPVTIFPGLSAQLAELMARLPKWAENTLKPILEDHMERHPLPGKIGKNAKVFNTRQIINVFIDREVVVDGASALIDGAIINNAASGRALASVGSDVKGNHFIIEDGCAYDGAIMENAYIGQGARIGKGFIAHDSLFFANSNCENGEGCALFAGPYTTTVHKATLLISALTQFMNAGSGSNQSNHLYKMGPVHWGIMQRGVKSSSGSYVMWGAKIGAFSLLVGDHKMHPDSSDFPFSYLFGDERGGTIVVPGIMLRSSGLLRDEKKWPLRERRKKRGLPLHDRINFEVLNTATVGAMARALPLIDELRRLKADDDRFVRYKGMKFRVSNLERAHRLYSLGICKYLHTKLKGNPFPPKTEEAPGEWFDLSGQFVTRQCIDEVLKAESIEEMERLLTECYENYQELEMKWIGSALADWGKRNPAIIEAAADEFDRMMEEDRKAYLQSLNEENAMLSLL